MAKDPAVLFYYQDFLVGIEFMDDNEVGKYIRLLCHQADKGRLSNKQVLSICKASVIPEFVKEKFLVDENGLYYNKRMSEEKVKRQNFSESRRKNALSDKAYAEHMEDENENTNENIILDLNGNGVIVNSWNAFAEMKGLNKIIKLTDKRKSNIKSRLAESDFNFDRILQSIDESDFLKGKNKEGWKVDFDFIFGSKNNYIKILEGKYATNNDKNGGASTDELANTVARRFKKLQGT